MHFTQKQWISFFKQRVICLCESVGWLLFKAPPLYWKHKATQKPISSSHGNCSLLLDSDWLAWMLSGLCNKVLVNWLRYGTCYCFVQKSYYDETKAYSFKKILTVALKNQVAGSNTFWLWEHLVDTKIPLEMQMILKHWNIDRRRQIVVPLNICKHFSINLEYIPGWC